MESCWRQETMVVVVRRLIFTHILYGWILLLNAAAGGDIKQVIVVVGQTLILHTGCNESTNHRDQFIWSLLPENDVLVNYVGGQLQNETQDTPRWISELKERIVLERDTGSLKIEDVCINDTHLYYGQVHKARSSYFKFNVTVLGPPVVHVYAKESKNPTTIILHCLATGFFPKDAVTLDIKRNGRVLDELDGIQSTDVRPNGDGTYQNEKHVEILRSDSSKFSCELKHPASNMHIAKDWDPQPGADWNIHPALPWVIGVVLFLCLCPFAAYFLIIKKWNIGEINKEGTRMQQTIWSWVLWRVRGSGGRFGDQPEQPGMPLLDEVVVGGEKQTVEPIQPPADAEEGSTVSPSQDAGDGEGQTTQ